MPRAAREHRGGELVEGGGDRGVGARRHQRRALAAIGGRQRAPVVRSRPGGRRRRDRQDRLGRGRLCFLGLRLGLGRHIGIDLGARFLDRLGDGEFDHLAVLATQPASFLLGLDRLGDNRLFRSAAPGEQRADVAARPALDRARLRLGHDRLAVIVGDDPMDRRQDFLHRLFLRVTDLGHAASPSSNHPSIDNSSIRPVPKRGRQPAVGEGQAVSGRRECGADHLSRTAK